ETPQHRAEEVCAEAAVDPAQVYEIFVTGNQTMIQIALGIDPEPLSMAPCTLVARRLPEATAADFGVRAHPRAPAVMFPALGAYVGPDIVAGILATGITLDRRVRLFIDVGTNSEIVLGSSAKTLATAAPAGPAFEAAQIRCGMRAADGAIEGVKIVDGEVELTVIGDVAPVGLCGSGLVDAVAELVAAGVLDPSGRFVLGSSERLGRQRRRRGGEDRSALRHGARRRAGDPRGGRVRRALRAHGLQRPVRRPAEVPRMSTVVVACGALALHVKKIAARRGWDVEVRSVPPELHNRPEKIRAAVEATAAGDEVVVAYAPCGADLTGYARLPGAHCYEVYGAEHEPATYFLTDFLVRSFDRVVWRGLGLDRHPELLAG